MLLADAHPYRMSADPRQIDSLKRNRRSRNFSSATFMATRPPAVNLSCSGASFSVRNRYSLGGSSELSTLASRVNVAPAKSILVNARMGRGRPPRGRDRIFTELQEPESLFLASAAGAASKFSKNSQSHFLRPESGNQPSVYFFLRLFCYGHLAVADACG